MPSIIPSTEIQSPLLNLFCTKTKIPDIHRFANHRKDTIEKFEYILKHAEKNKTLSNEIKEKFKLKKK